MRSSFPQSALSALAQSTRPNAAMQWRAVSPAPEPVLGLQPRSTSSRTVHVRVHTRRKAGADGAKERGVRSLENVCSCEAKWRGACSSVEHRLRHAIGDRNLLNSQDPHHTRPRPTPPSSATAPLIWPSKQLLLPSPPLPSPPRPRRPRLRRGILLLVVSTSISPSSSSPRPAAFLRCRPKVVAGVAAPR